MKSILSISNGTLLLKSVAESFAFFAEFSAAFAFRRILLARSDHLIIPVNGKSKEGTEGSFMRPISSTCGVCIV
jgi:hypothetical protein